jgi:hypothetical protein
VVLVSRTVDLIGYRLIAYMLEVRVAGLDAVLARPDDDRASVVAMVGQIGERLVAHSETLPGNEALALSPLVSSVGDPPLANFIRAGVVPTDALELSDRPLALLEAIAFDALPALIAEDTHRNAAEPEHSVGFSSSVIYSHPAASGFAEAILADEDLNKLFPGRDETGEAVGFHLYASGSGGGEQAVMLASSLLRAAWTRCDEDTPESLFAAVRFVLQSARSLGRSSVANAVVRIGFRGLRIPEGVLVSLPWGVLRSRHITDFQMGLGKGPFAEQIDVVLEATRDVPVLIGASFEQADDRWTEMVQDWHSESELIKRKTALAVLLALNRDPPVGLAPVVEHVVKVGSSGDSMSWQPQPLFRSPVGIEAGDKDRIEASAELVERWYSPRVDIATARTLRSLAERADPVDGLIDAL